jgi:hypothetical protein
MERVDDWSEQQRKAPSGIENENDGTDVDDPDDAGVEDDESENDDGTPLQNGLGSQSS